MRELILNKTRELTMDELLLVGGGMDADRQVPDPSHGDTAEQASNRRQAGELE
jgi:hypothetical protein